MCQRSEGDEGVYELKVEEGDAMYLSKFMSLLGRPDAGAPSDSEVLASPVTALLHLCCSRVAAPLDAGAPSDSEAFASPVAVVLQSFAALL